MIKNKPVALIVGASTGLGAALALLLSDRYHLLLLSSNKPRLERLDDQLRIQGYSATLIPFDLSKNHENIDSIVAGIWQRFKRLDLLIGLAAVITAASPLSHLEPKSFERMMMINCIAHYRFIYACDAMMRHTSKSRILMIGGNMQYNCNTDNSNNVYGTFTTGYDTSKAALYHMISGYSRELTHTTLKAALVVPHPFDSRLRRIIYPGQPREQLSSATLQAMQINKYLFKDNWSNGTCLYLNS